MKKSKRDILSEECRCCLRPFGFPLCAHDMDLTKELTIKDFPLCWDIKECPYEKELTEREKNQPKGKRNEN